ncbi:MAG: glycoside hydrolase family 13 protein [Muribaculaceae bacterium]|nr:glycoside hydrolase family 13 protein [Muribaculaceae bacterium]
MITFKKTFLAALVLCSFTLMAAKDVPPTAEPAFWWTGMNESSLQIMVSKAGIRDAEVSINYPDVKLDSVVRLDSPNYQLLYLNISQIAKPGRFDIVFKMGKKKSVLSYELKARKPREFKPFSSEDVLYLIMPDRFSDGDATNNNINGLRFPSVVDRNNPNARHGGDLKGIENHLDYIDSLGVTAIWLTPVLENDMPHGSYHGYATTDYYKVDPRFGTNDDYKSLIASAHKKGLKVVMDMIFNHTGVAHKWLEDMPSKDWYNHPKGDVMTNFRLSTVNDPYKSDYDYDRSVNGWFVPSMPDLNQRNPYLLKYLSQNSIWWIENAQIDGIRMDTHPYADLEKMGEWLAAVEKEYPGYNIVGECWYGDVSGTAYWQKDSRLNKNSNSNLKTVMDFPTMILARKAFNSETTRLTGLNEIYDRLSQDYLYEDSQRVLTFLENHDSDRFLESLPKSLGSWKQAITFLLTTRGIPQLYYGCELLMNGTKEGSDGYVRRDIPGGFSGDKNNEFTSIGRSDMQNEAWNFLSKIANWRRGNDVIAKGSLKHFMPENGLYVYQRSYKGKRVVVMMNGNDKPITIDASIYNEILPLGTKLKDMLSDNDITISATMTFQARAIYILE